MANIEVNEPIPDNPEEQTEQAASIKTSIFKLNRQHKLIAIAVLAVVIAAIIATLSLLNDRKQLKQEVDRLSNPQAQQQNEAEELKKEIGQYLQLPADEIPTVATVVDANKVKGQSFFANSENGDKVLLFAKSGKAILYRPSTKKIIEVAPINLNDQQTQTSPINQETTNTQQNNR